MRKLAPVAAACLLAALAGCKSNEACENCTPAEGEAATISANDTCPLSGQPVSAGVETVSFNGQDVGFCCDGCASKFEALSDADKAAKLASR